MLLKELTALRGVSGDEGEVRSFIVDQAAPWCDEIKVDNMGSVIAWKHSKTDRNDRCAHGRSRLPRAVYPR